MNQTEIKTIVSLNILTSDMLEAIKVRGTKEAYIDKKGESYDASGDVKYKGVNFNYSEIKDILKADGTIWSWGLNNYGQLALGNNINANIPAQIKIDKRAVQTAVGSNHIVVLTEEGKVYTAGLNSNGQLGNGTTTNSNNLVKVIDEYGKEIENIARVSAFENKDDFRNL